VLGTVRLTAMVMSAFCMGTMAGMIIEWLKLGGQEEQRKLWEMGIMSVSFQFGTLLSIWLYVQELESSFGQGFGLGSGAKLPVIGLGLMAGLLFFPFAVEAQTLCGVVMKWMHLKPSAQALVEELQDGGMGVGAKLFFGFMAIVVAPVTEELLFRGILYPTVKQAGYPKAALWGTALVFGLVHFNLASFVPLVLLSIVLCYLYEWTDNLLAPICAHSVFNTVAFIVLLLQ